MVMSTPRPPESGKERRSWEERPRSDTVHRTGSAEPSHPVDLTSLGADHVPHPASEHTARGGPAAARPTPRSETDTDGHDGSLAHGGRSHHDGQATAGRAIRPADGSEPEAKNHPNCQGSSHATEARSR